MCLKTGKVKIAEEDIKVYKVCTLQPTKYRKIETLEEYIDMENEEFHNLFMGFTGHHIDYIPFPQYIASTTLRSILDHPAQGFQRGYGYCAFLSVKIADSYRIRLDCGDTPFINIPLYIVRLCIPKGSYYATGCIQPQFLGGDLPAVRCHRLQPYKGD